VFDSAELGDGLQLILAELAPGTPHHGEDAPIGVPTLGDAERLVSIAALECLDDLLVGVTAAATQGASRRVVNTSHCAVQHKSSIATRSSAPPGSHERHHTQAEGEGGDVDGMLRVAAGGDGSNRVE
jgi:hypothetical protein